MGIMSILAAGGKNRAMVALTISANTNNYDVYTNRGGAYVAGKSDITVTINSGVIVGSTSTAAYALTVSNSFAAGDTVTIINNGTIVGKGGNGGNNGSTGGAGGAGGHAISLSRATSITNNGLVAGGGGGGSGGANYTYVGGMLMGTQSALGGSGGGGAGTNAGAGGSGASSGTATTGGAGSSGGGSNPGGAGGARGAAGGGANGGAGGGAAGYYTVGNANATWTVTGTRSGNVS